MSKKDEPKEFKINVYGGELHIRNDKEISIDGKPVTMRAGVNIKQGKKDCLIMASQMLAYVDTIQANPEIRAELERRAILEQGVQVS